MTSTDRIAAAVASLTGWMREHGAALLADNLSGAASEADLARAREWFGFDLPADLLALWSLHHGQHHELNGFVESYDLFDVDRALGERDTVQQSVDFLREAPDDFEAAGITAAEAASDHWVAFAGRDSDLLIVSGVSGRVFSCGKDVPPLHRLADSVATWAEQYAARVLADEYAVEEGFGDYYLQQRDRKAEARDLARQQQRDEQRRYREATPLLTQLHDALVASDAERCRDVFERIAATSPASMPQAVDALFASGRDARLIATALQLVLDVVTLTGLQWRAVADGADRLGNNAIRDRAMAVAG